MPQSPHERQARAVMRRERTSAMKEMGSGRLGLPACERGVIAALDFLLGQRAVIRFGGHHATSPLVCAEPGLNSSETLAEFGYFGGVLEDRAEGADDFFQRLFSLSLQLAGVRAVGPPPLVTRGRELS